MARTFVITDAESDSDFNVGDSGETAGLTTFDREILEGGSGTLTGTTDIDNDAADRERAVIAFQTDTGAPEPNDATWESGDYVVNINVTTGRAGISWRATYLMSRTSGGTFTTRASLTGQTDTLEFAGTITHTVVLGSPAAVNATDTMYFLLVFGGALEHGNSTVVVTMGENIVTPLNAVGGPPFPYHIFKEKRRDMRTLLTG